MNFIFAEADNIYFAKTKKYFNEVVSSYSIGNYRSAIVMLYSVAICDILFKLQELKDMFNDSVAIQILDHIDKCKNKSDNKSKSKWEKELVDEIYDKTELLDLEAYTSLNHLYDYRNFSAHPAMNDNYELIEPTGEMTAALIKNTLLNILVKPPLFIKSITDTLTEDLKDKKTIYLNQYNELKLYLNNKYYLKMSETMKKATFKALWKLCFCLPDDVDCTVNRKINRYALEILYDGYSDGLVSYIKENESYFSVSNNEECIKHLVVFLSKCENIYSFLSNDTRLIVDKGIDESDACKALAWFKYTNINDHIDYLKKFNKLTVTYDIAKKIYEHYVYIGEKIKILDYYIWFYGESECFDCADARYITFISPYLDDMDANQLIELIRVTNKNNQIYDRRRAFSANRNIMNRATIVLPKEFDYTEYGNFYDERFT